MWCRCNAWWRRQTKTSSALLALYARNSPVTGEFPAQRPVTRSFDVFFDLRLNKPLSKQSWGWWFETLSCSLWRHYNGSNDFLIFSYRRDPEFDKEAPCFGVYLFPELTGNVKVGDPIYAVRGKRVIPPGPVYPPKRWSPMMTSSYGNTSCNTGPCEGNPPRRNPHSSADYLVIAISWHGKNLTCSFLTGEFPSQKASNAGRWCFLLLAWTSFWTSRQLASNLRR